MSWGWCWASRSFSPRLCCPEKSSSSGDPNYRKNVLIINIPTTRLLLPQILGSSYQLLEGSWLAIHIGTEPTYHEKNKKKQLILP